MSIALDLLGISCFVRIPKAVVLSNSRGVLGWMWPISISIIRNSTAILALTYPPAISASDAAPITFRNILASTWIGALMNVHCGANGLEKLGLFPRKWYPPTLLHPPRIERYDESDETHNIISDALNVIDGLGYVAI